MGAKTIIQTLHMTPNMTEEKVTIKFYFTKENTWMIAPTAVLPYVGCANLHKIYEVQIVIGLSK